MKAVFNDLQDCTSKLDGAEVENRAEVESVFRSLQARPPFVCELIGENGFKLVLGISPSVGCAQHCPENGDIPYLMALSAVDDSRGGYFEFMMGGTPTPIETRHCLPIALVKEIAVHFVETGERLSTLKWLEI